jgi:VCBS repeat protein
MPARPRCASDRPDRRTPRWIRFARILSAAPLLAVGSRAAQAPPAPKSVRVVQTLAPEFPLAAHRLIDVDGDGRRDLLVLGRAGEVRVFRHATNEHPLGPKPVGELVLADPRHSLVDTARWEKKVSPLQLFVASPRGVQVFPPGADGGYGGSGPILAPRARFQLRVPSPTFADLAQDVNADGRLDLVLPAADRCELWLNEGPREPAGGTAGAPEGPALPGFRKAAEVTLAVSSSVASDAEELSDILEASFSIPALTTSDVNGDGRPDLLVVDGSRRSFHLQREDGSLPAEPDVTVDLSIFRDSIEEAEIRPGHTLAAGDEATYESRDLDGDKIPDYVIAHRRKVWVFHASRAGPQFKEPSTILKASDDITALTLVRLDDDALPDLLLVKVQVPTIATLIRGLFGEWDVEVSSAGYLNQGGRHFETQPSLKSTLTVRLPAILDLVKHPENFLKRFEDLGGRFRQSVTGDFDGNGTLDIALVSTDGARLELWYGAAKQGAAPADEEDLEPLLRQLLFQDPNRVWDLERVVLWLGDFAERRTALMTGGRPADGSLPLRDKSAARLSTLEAGDVDGDGKAEVLLRYELRQGTTVFDLL